MADKAKTMPMPVDPTPEMIQAGEDALTANTALNKTGLGGASAEAVYRAMMKAGHPTKEDKEAAKEAAEQPDPHPEIDKTIQKQNLGA